MSDSRLKAILKGLDENAAPARTPVASAETVSASAFFEHEVERLESWLAAADRVAPERSAEDRRLARTTARFALSVWAHAAIAAGWTDGELFAIGGGLIPEMARRTLHILNFNETAARLMTGRGEIEEWARDGALAQAAPWWREAPPF